MGKKLTDFVPFVKGTSKGFVRLPRFAVGDWVSWRTLGFGWTNAPVSYGQVVLVMGGGLNVRSGNFYDILPVEYMNVLEHKRLVCREEDALTPTTETEALLSVLERAANA